MAWPLSQDYNEAIQTPAQCFVDPDLRQGEAVTNALGMPTPYSGNFADVYAVVSGQNKWAVKCFTRQIEGLRERYAEISDYLTQVQLPFMVEFKYLDQGIRVRGQWYPILKMQWVEGASLNQFVKTHLDKPRILEQLCTIWPKLAARLNEARLAHGDLQHGNVLLVQEREGKLSIKLVDYDGMCVPTLVGSKATEVGHPSYQHPQRASEGTLGPHIDRFSTLVVQTALRALTVGGRALWDRFDNGDNLLFNKKDFENPNDSPVFKDIRALNDAEVGRLAVALADTARQPVKQTPRLEDVIAGGSQAQAAKLKPVAGDSGKSSSPIPLENSEPRKKRRMLKRVALVAVCGLLIAGIVVGVDLVSQQVRERLTKRSSTEKASVQTTDKVSLTTINMSPKRDAPKVSPKGDPSKTIPKPVLTSNETPTILPPVEPPPLPKETPKAPLNPISELEAELAAAKTVAEFTDYAEKALRLMDQALDEKRLGDAMVLAFIAKKAAGKADKPEITNRIVARLSSVVTTTRTVTVVANKFWQKGPAVNAGEVVIITAKGSWNTWPQGGPTWKSGANGTQYPAPKGFPLPDAPQGALVGKVGNQVLLIGSTFMADDLDGSLEFANNDDHRRADNLGTLSVTVSVIKLK